MEQKYDFHYKTAKCVYFKASVELNHPTEKLLGQVREILKYRITRGLDLNAIDIENCSKEEYEEES